MSSWGRLGRWQDLVCAGVDLHYWGAGVPNETRILSPTCTAPCAAVHPLPPELCQVQRVKSLYFQSLMRQEVAWHDAHAPGDLTQRLQQLSNDLHAGMGNKLGLAVSGTQCSLKQSLQCRCVLWRLHHGQFTNRIANPLAGPPSRSYS